MQKRKNRHINVEEFLADLNKPRGNGPEAKLETRLHAGQIDLLSPIYSEDKFIIFGGCSRKFGKSEAACYAAWRHAGTNPNSVVLLVGPEKDHISDVYWDTQRMQRFMGDDTQKYITSIRDREKQIFLENGSMIKLMGSENWMRANGIEPDLLIYDEFKGFHPKFHGEMAPNLAPKKAKLLIIGTIPRPGDRNKEQYDSLEDYCKTNPRGFYRAYTTWDNPINHLPGIKETIQAMIDQYAARGEHDIIQNEFYSRRVPGGSKSVFPMFDRDEHVKPHGSVIGAIGDPRKYEWFIAADPGNTKTFAVLFGCINPYTKKVYILDEIYEKDRKKTTASKIMPEILKKAYEFFPHSDINDSWFKVADEAANWFITDCEVQFDIFWTPTMKHLNKKENGISLIKDALLHNLIIFSDRCVCTIKELEEMSTDDKGEIPKHNDHATDALRYLFGIANYDIVEAIRAVHEKPYDYAIKEGRFRSIGATLYDDDIGYDWHTMYDD